MNRNSVKMTLQIFAEKRKNVKILNEKRAEKVTELETLYATIEGEQRAITDEEEAQVRALTDEIDRIDNTIKILNEMKTKISEKHEEGDTGETEERAETDRIAFANYLRGVVSEERAENLTLAENGAVIPKTIAQKIIKRVYDISPIAEKATRYNVKGNLEIPYYPSEESDIKVSYANEFVDLTSSVGKFGTISLKGFLAGALTLISKSLINNNQFDIVSFVIEHMAYSIARWVEQELLNGTESKITGLRDAKNKVIAKAANAITSDEMIDLQDSVKDAYQKDAMWIMNSKTRTAIKKLKDGNGRYLLQDDINAPYGKTILGKPVYVSDNMPEMGASKKAIFYGDPSGLALKISEEMEIQVLREKYATQHAVGVVAWLEIDSKIENEQKIAVLEMAEG